MDLESVADELYSLPRHEFTAARNAAAQRAREQGRRELTEQIGALRRPSTAAWLANRLAREHPERIQALMELGDGLREAQRRLQGEQLRRLSQQRHELVHAVVQQVHELARTAGHPVSDAITRELVGTFTAAVNSSAAAQALAGGRLTAALDPADAATDLFAGAGAFESSRRDPDSAGGVSERHRELEHLRTEAADARTARDEAQRALTNADQAVDDAATALRELRARLEVAGQAEHEARNRARSAQRDVEAADRAAAETQQRVHDLEGLLAQHRGR
ncbi:MAG: hypothetical protein DLM61_04880 [Pseudonocardiales bacterium]|nr:MAG: hypothetical protein DLM61_04880 [Pseudonocardiales bacterium]